MSGESMIGGALDRRRRRLGIQGEGDGTARDGYGHALTAQKTIEPPGSNE
jgi:hypothetical protein